MSPPQRCTERKRRHHNKTLNGCAVCKRRHLKCDEHKPTCYRCMLASKACNYDVPQPKLFPPRPNNHKSHDADDGSGSPPPSPPQAITTALFQSSAAADALERRGFQYFVERTRESLAGFTSFTRTFWHTLIPQLSATEPAIRHIAIALAARHELETLSASSSSSPPTNLATFCDRQHGLALATLAQLHAPANEHILLLSCIAFIAFERLRDVSGMRGLYLTYMCAGLKILRDRVARRRGLATTTSSSCHRGGAPEEFSLIDNFIEPMFFQMELMFSMFCPPNRLVVRGDGDAAADDHGGGSYNHHHLPLDPPRPEIPARWTNLRAASRAFYCICVSRYALCRRSLASSSQKNTENTWTATSPAFAEIWAYVSAWQRSTEAYMAGLGAGVENDAERRRATVLRHQVCLLVGALLYSVRPEAAAAGEGNCYPEIVDLRQPGQRLSIFVGIAKTRSVNVSGINRGPVGEGRGWMG